MGWRFGLGTDMAVYQALVRERKVGREGRVVREDPSNKQLE